MQRTERGVSRREFIKAAVAIGGASALAACTQREKVPDLETGPDDPSSLPERQHEWGPYLAKDDHELTGEAGYDFSYESFVAAGDGVAIHSGRACVGYTGKLTDDTEAEA